MIATRNRWRAVLLAFGITFSATGCESMIGNDEVPPPIGIGTELNELKRSPCACLEIPQDYRRWQRAS